MNIFDSFDLRQAIQAVSPEFNFYRMHEEYLWHIKRIVDGGCKRLIVNAPPRHHKSEFFGKILPAAFLSAYPDRHVGICSYSRGLAAYSTGRALDYYFTLSSDHACRRQSMAQFSTAAGGGYWSTGTLGPVIGRAADLMVIDDPTKNLAEGASETYMERLWEYYQTSLRTRLLPGAALVVVTPRLGVNDFTGRILREQAMAPWDLRENWTVVSLPALGDERPMRSRFPAHFTVEPDWRRDGDPLCPELYDRATLERIRRFIGEEQWSCLYQQLPAWCARLSGSTP